jgi:hypothetical protein
MNGQVLGLLAFAIVAGAGIRWYVLIQRVAIPRDRTLLYGFFGIGAFFGLLALLSHPGWVVGPLAFVSLIVGAAFPLLRLRSTQVPAEPAVPVGATVPFFAAEDELGKRFESPWLSGKPYLLKFFRGHW